jgi:autophagy-related protein 9
MEYHLLADEESDNSRETSPDNSIFETSHIPSDNDLIKIYNYFQYKGYYNIVSIQLINLITTLFLYFLFIILFLCVDYQGLIELRTNERYISEYINFNNLLNTNFFYVTCMILMSVYCLIRIQGIIQDILKYRGIRYYYRDELNINSKKLSTFSWDKIIEILSRKYGKEINAYNINSRILRKDNIMCDLFRTKLNKFLYSSLMEWNLSYCILNNIVDERNQVTNKIFTNIDGVKKDIKKNMIIISCLTFIFMPFLMIYVFFYSFLKYGANFYNHPSKIVTRQWSLKAKWEYRYYNELKHNLDGRLDKASVYAKEYCNQFNSKVFETITKFLVFLASSFFIILLFFSLLNEHLLFNLNITYDKPIIWYMGILGSIIALGKNINNERKSTVHSESFEKLSCKVKYIPRQWEQIYDPIKIKNNIIKFYEYQIVTLLKECLMVISIPFVLLYLCNYINSIVEFINDNLEHDNKIGYISKKSNFKNIRDDSDLKTIISFKEFRDTYPEWGENIEKFLVNSEIYNNLKNDINIDEENLPIESAISLI